MNNETETAFLRKAQAVFADSAADLEAEALARLRAARARAVETVGECAPRRRTRSWALPVGAVAVICAAVIGGLVWWSLASQPSVPFAAGNNEDMTIVLSNDNLDMYADMDFYRWLQAQQQQQQKQSASQNSGANNNG